MSWEYDQMIANLMLIPKLFSDYPEKEFLGLQLKIYTT